MLKLARARRSTLLSPYERLMGCREEQEKPVGISLSGFLYFQPLDLIAHKGSMPACTTSHGARCRRHSG